jgi:L,D-transpeptidase catalytic domain
LGRLRPPQLSKENGDTLSQKRSSLARSASVAVALAAAALVLPTPSAHAEGGVFWNPPTPSDQSQFSVSTGSEVTFTLVASTSAPSAPVHIGATGGLMPGATLSTTDGGVARATFAWTPSETQAGDYTVQFTASTPDGATAPTLTYVIHVTAAIVYPRSYTLTDDKVGRWAFVLRRAPVRSKPKASARVMTRLSTITTDFTQNLVLVLDAVDISPKQTWYHVRLPILPNNTTGWVRRGYLSKLRTVRTHLYVDRRSFTATLQRDGVPIFKAVVGVGRSYWPTPRGEFYIRDKLTNFGDPFYGPVAFGTSARSAVLTDWPGGGFVGVHGTNQPGILPGPVSHGCIRMRNPSIVQLERLMPVGTPLTIA